MKSLIHFIVDLFPETLQMKDIVEGEKKQKAIRNKILKELSKSEMTN